MKRKQSMAADSKSARAPAMRFPEFRDDPAWGSKELHTIADPVSERADSEDENNILTLSAEQGLVLQSEYFGKQIAGTSSDRYLKIQSDDFVYNDRTTKASEYGTIKRLTKHSDGVVSPIYKCFRFKDGQRPAFWEWYFESGAHQGQLRGLANEGARAGRFNVSIDRFLSTSVFTPDHRSAEQQKIAECLSTLDELIGAERQKLDALKAHKKGLMQQLFPREGEALPCLRFPEFRSAPEWDIRTIGDMFRLINGCAFKPEDWKSSGTPIIRIQNLNDPSAEFNYSQAPVLEVNRIEPGDLLFAWSGTLGSSFGARIWNGPTGVLNQHIFKVLMDEQQITPRFALLALARVEEDIAKQTHGFKTSFVHVKKSDLIKVQLPLPPVPEQRRIASCFSSLEDLIAAQSDKFEALKTHKKGLMQQLFPSSVEAVE